MIITDRHVIVIHVLQLLEVIRLREIMKTNWRYLLNYLNNGVNFSWFDLKKQVLWRRGSKMASGVLILVSVNIMNK